MKTKKSVGGEIPIQILKASQITFEYLKKRYKSLNFWKNSISHSTEENGIVRLKLGNVTPIFKKK